MGFWGNGLYENDTSLDVKNQFEELLRDGETVENITSQLLDDFDCLMGDPEEETMLWFALADAQWERGMLLPSVKEQALNCIEKCKNASNNTKMLEDLKTKLLSPQPKVKKPSKRRSYKCEWKIGDVFAYKLESDLAKERGLFGRYFLIRKVDEGIWYPKHIVPIIYIKITKDEKLPIDIEEYNQLEYVQICFTRYEHRFLPIDGRRPKEDIAEKSKIHYEVDEYGFLPQYRIHLLNTSKNVIPSSLIYIGNYKDAIPPQKEFIPHSKMNIDVVFWKNFDETFETNILKRYCGHNLRELKSYQKI